MIIIKIKNLKSNSAFVKTTVWKIPKFHPTYRNESLCKVVSRHVYFAKSARTIFRYPFFNPVLKNTKMWQVFVTISKNIPDNWTKIGYTFGLVKHRPNKRSGKVRIKSQIVRVTTFLCKNIADCRWWQPITYFTHFSGETLSFSIVNGDRTIFSSEHFKRWVFIIIYNTQTSFMKPVYFSICRAIGRHED